MRGEKWIMNGAGILPNLFSSVVFQLLLQLVSPRCESPTQLFFLVWLLTSFNQYDLFQMKTGMELKAKKMGSFWEPG